MSDSASPPRSASDPSSSGPVVLFDGVCSLCHSSVRWIIRRDRRILFRFASLQSRTAMVLLKKASASAGAPSLEPSSEQLSADPSAIFLVDPDSGQLWTKSDAWLQIVRRLSTPWSWLTVLGILPRGLRDAVYDYIAHRRYRWFGKKESCPLPDPGQKNRFLD